MGILYSRPNRDYVTVAIVRVNKMKQNSIHNWSPHLRHRIWKKTYSQIPKSEGGSFKAHVSELCTKDKIGEMVLNLFSNGTYQVRLYSHAKTKTHCKPVTIAEVKINEDYLGNDKITNIKLYPRIKRLWFWKQNNKV